MALPNYSSRDRDRDRNQQNRRGRKPKFPYTPVTPLGTPGRSGVQTDPFGGYAPRQPQPTVVPGQPGYNQTVDWTQPLTNQSVTSSASAGTTQATSGGTAQTQSSAIYQPPAATHRAIAPVQSEAHPFYDPTSNYYREGVGQPNPSNSFATPNTELHRTWSNQNPEGYYYAFLNHRGLGGLDARSQTAQSMYRDAMTGYQAAKLNNAELDLSDYLAQWDVERLLAQMTNEQLGIDDSRYKARNRWGMRAV